MNTIGYIITAAIVFTCLVYILLMPVWGRRRPKTQWGRGGGYQPTEGRDPPLNPPSGGSAGTRAPPRRVIIEDQRASPRPQSAARMRSVRHETRKPRSPVRAVPAARAEPVPTETPGDISTLLTIAAFDSAVSDCAPSDSGSSSDGGSCDSGGGGGGGD